MNDRPESGGAKKKKKLPKFNRIREAEPVQLRDPALAQLTDHTEVKVDGESIDIAIKDMESLAKLGQGQYGTVEKVKHRPTELIFAVKIIRCSMTDKEQRSLLKELNVSMRSSNCPYVVVSYGAMFQGGDVWIMMELLDNSLKDFYDQIRKCNQTTYIDEPFISYITFCVVTALEYLHCKLKVIHRDVKPSNILLDRSGRVKVCDFGISGDLINSLAKTNVGSQPYLAPERIDPKKSGNGYTIKADVWSLGLTVLELAILQFPYRKWNSLFDQLREVVNGPSPSLPEDSPYTDVLRNFLNRCLSKEDSLRASYDELIEDDLLKGFKDEDRLLKIKEEFSIYVTQILEQKPNQ